MISDTTDREIRVSQVFDAPRELVWKAWTDPKHVVKWWGPDGFTTTIEAMDVRPGGVWKHTMHGPDGTDYPNKSVFVEVLEPERIVYTHGGGTEGKAGASFEATWTFEAEGEGTRVTIHMVFASKEARDQVVRDYNAIEGGKQTLGRLAEHVSSMTATAPGENEVEVIRLIEAPRALVFEAWSRAEHVREWLGPKGFTLPECEMDFREGGAYRYVMRGPDGVDYPFHGLYRKIVEPEWIVFSAVIEDSPDQELVTTVRLEEAGQGTKVTVRQTVPVAEQHAKGQAQGWSETLGRLGDFAVQRVGTLR